MTLRAVTRRPLISRMRIRSSKALKPICTAIQFLCDRCRQRTNTSHTVRSSAWSLRGLALPDGSTPHGSLSWFQTQTSRRVQSAQMETGHGPNNAPWPVPRSCGGMAPSLLPPKPETHTWLMDAHPNSPKTLRLLPVA